MGPPISSLSLLFPQVKSKVGPVVGVQGSKPMQLLRRCQISGKERTGILRYPTKADVRRKPVGEDEVVVEASL